MISRAWMDQANCKDADPNLFYGDDGSNTYFEGHAICKGCPVRNECLQDAMTSESPSARYGLRGDTTPDQRAAIYRTLKRQRAS